MSGHSRWSNIKRTKGKSDAAKARVFTKIGRELAVAIKSGGADPNTNSRLRDVIIKARECNMPNDNVQRSIKKASGELNAINYENIVYEGYAVGGVAVIAEALTDNKNRTAGEVRHKFDKYGAGMGTTGCVSFLFNTLGVIVLEKESNLSKTEDELTMICIDLGADDFISEEDNYIVYTSVANYSGFADGLAKKGIVVSSSQIARVPTNYIDLDNANAEKLTKLVDALEDDDDIQNVYHNGNL